MINKTEIVDSCKLTNISSNLNFQNTLEITTEKGDVNIKGSKVTAKEEITINLNGESSQLNLIEVQDLFHSEYEHIDINPNYLFIAGGTLGSITQSAIFESLPVRSPLTKLITSPLNNYDHSFYDWYAEKNKPELFTDLNGNKIEIQTYTNYSTYKTDISKIKTEIKIITPELNSSILNINYNYVKE